MQMTMTMEARAWCGRPLLSREPAAPGRLGGHHRRQEVAPPVHFYHVKRGCYDAAKCKERSGIAHT